MTFLNAILLAGAAAFLIPRLIQRISTGRMQTLAVEQPAALKNHLLFFCVLKQLLAAGVCYLFLSLEAQLVAGIVIHPHQQDWRIYYAWAVTTGLCLYTSFRLGIYYGQSGRDLPNHWLGKLFGIGLCLGVVTPIVGMGSLDFWPSVVAATAPDCWLPGDELHDRSAAQWGRSLLLGLLTYGLLVLMARWCFGSPSPLVKSAILNPRSAIG